jgi:hypothetical protein
VAQLVGFLLLITSSAMTALASRRVPFSFRGWKMRNLKEAFGESGDAVETGDYAKALELLIWIHDNPNPADPSSELYRRAYGFLALGVLAEVYEPAKQALIDLVTKKRDRVAAGLADTATEPDLRALEAVMRRLHP